MEVSGAMGAAVDALNGAGAGRRASRVENVRLTRAPTINLWEN